MSKIFLEYIWLDGNNPQTLRSKTKIVYDLYAQPYWSFDGIYTKQTGSESNDLVLKPVYSVKDPFRGGPHKLVLCEVLNSDGVTPHISNTRNKLSKLTNEFGFKDLDINTYDDVPWFGWQQQYVITHPPDRTSPFKMGGGIPLAFTTDSNNKPRPEGDYYCGVGGLNVIGRNISEEHLTKCEEINLDISGINAEALIGQWRYNIGPVTTLNGSDQLCISRYILERIAEKHGLGISYHPKPVNGDWNTSGCHFNFSTKETRDDMGIHKIYEICDKLEKRHNEHIKVYGEFNDLRLTGNNGTSNIDRFTSGIGSKSPSVRIPMKTYKDKKGYIEDRRPAANCDPYKVSYIMLETIYDKAGIIEEKNEKKTE